MSVRIVLWNDLERILQVFRKAGVPFEVIGGLAVNPHLMAAFQRSRSFLTLDIDFLVKRSDLDQLFVSQVRRGTKQRK